MKRFLLIPAGWLVALGLGGASWWPCAGASPPRAPQDDQGSAFTWQPSGAGRLVKLPGRPDAAARLPLAAAPAGRRPGGPGAGPERPPAGGPVPRRHAQDLLLVLQPAGVQRRLLALRALRQAALAPAGRCSCCYRAGDPARRSSPWRWPWTWPASRCCGPAGGPSRAWPWARRGTGVYLYGGQGPVQRLPLVPARRRPGAAGARGHRTARRRSRTWRTCCPPARAAFLVATGTASRSTGPASGWTHSRRPDDGPGPAWAGSHPWPQRQGRVVAARPRPAGAGAPGRQPGGGPSWRGCCRRDPFAPGRAACCGSWGRTRTAASGSTWPAALACRAGPPPRPRGSSPRRPGPGRGPGRRGLGRLRGGGAWTGCTAGTPPGAPGAVVRWSRPGPRWTRRPATAAAGAGPGPGARAGTLLAESGRARLVAAAGAPCPSFRRARFRPM